MTYIEDITRALRNHMEILDRSEGKGGYYLVSTTYDSLSTLLKGRRQAIQVLFGAGFHRSKEEAGEWETISRGLRGFRKYEAPWHMLHQITAEWQSELQ
ncbi:hypothetical protein [Pseudohalocynthiibacter sp. F2068]|uniref:hypothetical protein n=1 Tax=Pseudohalocynthiibacter sp. F2068 TaxID=2926418 RepID=UPI001FF2EDAF|nr:hypothetical protein [Pseudohalocynthiibacter sp. F2068]MCK0104392.1 hypothetical protein [Pseudohalocynthiibacter sp. F2068]